MTTESPPQLTGLRSPRLWASFAFLVLPLSIVVLFAALSQERSQREGIVQDLLLLFTGLLLLQVVLGIGAIVAGVRSHRVSGHGYGAAAVGALAALTAVATWMGGIFLAALAFGSAWGRPLRVRGRQIHPELRSGSDWTAGDRPDPSQLDEPTRHALAALWLHDAQKEHASVPAFSRISWQLAAAGAPADLLAWSHRAALEEIEHARACFALAAGYEGRSHTVEPMPDLLLDGLQVRGNVLEVMAKESLGDGCQLEDFNADVAAACAEVCQEPVTRAVLERIAVEERSHAEFSWALLHWLLAQHAATVRPVLERTLAGLARYRRPTAVSFRLQRLVGRADPAQLLRHGRLPDARWAELWQRRLDSTGERLRAMLGSEAACVTTDACESETADSLR
ncbi:MAG TPA: hypothetical protein VFD82_12080 [Planctomycetota bacterium]|nr:hypothetical protein [Planctomycetota bacterium]